MSKMIPRERVIFDNYNTYDDDEVKEIAMESEWVESEEDITDSLINAWRYHLIENDWSDTKAILDKFFNGKTIGFFGKVGLWDGIYAAGSINKDFWVLFDKATIDCDYWKIYDENGHLYLTCSHHDGTNHFEIKELTSQGEEYLENWENNWNDKRNIRYIHNQIHKRYSKIPRLMEKYYGCMAREYEPINKATLIDKLNNQAKSFYC